VTSETGTTETPGVAATPHRGRGERRELRDGVTFGVVLIAAGVVLLLHRADVIEADTLFADWWPMLIVLGGVWWLLERAWAFGAVAIVLGLLALGDLRGIVDVPVGRLVLPALLLAAGVSLIAAGARLRRARPRGRTIAAVTDGVLPTGIAVFGDAHLTVPDDDVGSATVTTLSVFGDVHVEVPAGWRVRDRASAVFGSVRVPTDQPPYPEAPVVELHGFALFGDVTARYTDAPRGG
jgi:hypothetical protein